MTWLGKQSPITLDNKTNAALINLQNSLRLGTCIKKIGCDFIDLRDL